MNAAIKAKTEELEKIRIRARTIITEHPQGMPPEQFKAVTDLTESAKKLAEEIKADTKVEEVKSDLVNLDRFLDDPVHRIPHGVNGDSDERKAFVQKGWEIKGGVLYAPTSVEGMTWRRDDGGEVRIGKVAMYPEEVLFGDIPADDHKTAAYYKQTRAIFQPIYRDAYHKYVTNSVKYRSESMAFNMLTGAEQKALSEGTDTSGGFIVPPDVQAEMLVRLPQMAIMRQYCRVQPTNRDTLRWPAVAPNANASISSIVSSGFVGGWVGETPAFTDTDPGFESFDIAIKKIRCATRLSNDFVSDAAVNILAFLASNGAENMALVEDAGFLTGLGSALQPLGLLNVPGIPTTNVAGTTAHTISNTTAAAGSAPLLNTLAYSLPAQYVARARWIMRRTIEGEIRALTDGSGRPLWPPYMGSGFAAAPPDLLGFPVAHSDWMPTDGTANNTPLVLGDLSNYIIGQRTQITSVVLRERFADSDQVGIILFERVGGAAYNYDAFRIGYV